MRLTRAGVWLLALAWIVPLALLVITPMKSFPESPRARSRPAPGRT